MDAFNNFLLLLDSYLGSAAYFPFVLLGVGVFFTFYLGFPQIRYFKHALKVVSGKFDKKGTDGDTTHFQALATALSGTVGTGNIGGVALAIFLGGPAALFWMWVTAFLGMTTKFVEVTLSHKYRVKTADGTMAGGPMYYMDRRLNMKWLAVIFAVATIISSFGTGNMPQINNIAQSMQASFGFEPMLVGGILAIILALVIIGGITRIAAFTSRIVPIMAIIYIIGALSVIFYNVDQIIPSFVAVFADAFTGSAATGGFLGATFAYAFNRGVNRGLFSNEAGQGSAPIAHAAAKAEEPVSEGIVSILEPFIDTIIICTLTGLVILASGAWNQKYENVFARSDIDIISGHYSDQNEADRQTLYHYVNDTQDNTILKYDGVIEVRDGRPINDGFTILHARSVAENVRFIVAGEDPYNGVLRVEQGQLKKQDITIVGESLLHSAALTVKAFSMGFLGQKGEYIVPISLMLFAFSTAIAWSYYGDRAVVYLFGQRGVMPYRILYVAGFFVASFTDTTLVWTLSYVAIVLMTLPNLFGIMLLRREMKDTVKAYWQDFNADKIKKD
ncbi:alanine or glycine:cation symporter, AGCS family [Pseudidiomarina indica]|uniref:Alanine or glycine:cation symporter, AGCS family n=1 Tax=Pseudidiomarina indica TaxID=1159017 RepID=A0A1G6A5S8_9GAMM|nr:AGCS family amino acid carrier protein [Pseudidiomarina indica]SDB03797.1 alanine or glycine:cation symporter, AGCS family [Pseudidiomarina indica]